ncbi:MAG: hypothetical protein AAGA01_18875 [Cyanobacteria bacterium P01_E01_bin.43]
MLLHRDVLINTALGKQRSPLLFAERSDPSTKIDSLKGSARN